MTSALTPSALAEIPGLVRDLEHRALTSPMNGICMQRAAMTIRDQRSRLDKVNAENEKLHARVRDREIQFNGRQQALDELKAEVSRLTAELAAARKPQGMRFPRANERKAAIGWTLDTDLLQRIQDLTPGARLGTPTIQALLLALESLGAQDGGEDKS